MEELDKLDLNSKNKDELIEYIKYLWDLMDEWKKRKDIAHKKFCSYILVEK